MVEVVGRERGRGREARTSFDLLPLFPTILVRFNESLLNETIKNVFYVNKALSGLSPPKL